MTSKYFAWAGFHSIPKNVGGFLPRSDTGMCGGSFPLRNSSTKIWMLQGIRWKFSRKWRP